MITFAEFLEDVYDIVFPEGFPEGMELPIRNYVLNGLVNAQTYVPCLRSSNVDFFYEDDFDVRCNMMRGTGPRGRISSVYAFKPGGYCKRSFYDQKSTAWMSCYMNDWAHKNSCDDGDDCNNEAYGNYYCDAYAPDGEEDGVFLCDGNRGWAIGPNQKLYAAPRMPCGYVLAVHWEGLKYSYEDEDPLPDDPDLKNLIALWIESEMALRVDADGPKFATIRNPQTGTYTKALAEMIHRCREELRIRESTGGCPSSVDDSAIAGFNTPPQFASPE